jgi:hypothetical protein
MRHGLFAEYMRARASAFLDDLPMRAGRRQYTDDVRLLGKKLRAILKGRKSEATGNLLTPLRARLSHAYDLNAVELEIRLDVRFRDRPQADYTQGAPLVPH